MEALLNDLWGADGMSKTYVVISSVLRRNDAKAESNRKQINEQYKYVHITIVSVHRICVVKSPCLTMFSFQGVDQPPAELRKTD
jgi:hypothetical protein